MAYGAAVTAAEFTGVAVRVLHTFGLAGIGMAGERRLAAGPQRPPGGGPARRLRHSSQRPCHDLPLPWREASQVGQDLPLLRPQLGGQSGGQLVGPVGNHVDGNLPARPLVPGERLTLGDPVQPRPRVAERRPPGQGFLERGLRDIGRRMDVQAQRSWSRTGRAAASPARRQHRYRRDSRVPGCLRPPASAHCHRAAPRSPATAPSPRAATPMPAALYRGLNGPKVTPARQLADVP